MKGRPEWKLEDVKAIAAQSNGLKLLKTRARDFFPLPRDAYAAARRVIASLTESQFSETKLQNFGDKLDVYGVQVNGGGWMLKLMIDESKPQVVVMSLHPLERPLRTKGGMVSP